MKDIIDKFGLFRALLSIYPNLKGISFKDVIYDEVLNNTNPVLYLTQNIDDNWYFGQGNMAMIFRSVNPSEKNRIIESLLETNNLKKSNKQKMRSHKSKKIIKTIKNTWNMTYFFHQFSETSVSPRRNWWF